MPDLASERTAALENWWAQFDDAKLAQLIAQAQQASPQMRLAVARVDEARALARAAGAASWPSFDLSARASRAKSAVALGAAQYLYNSGGVALDASWEIDLFGRVRNNANAAAVRAQAASLQWHQARTTLAAEVAQTYIGLRSCQALSALLEQAAAAQARLAELSRLKVEAGFEAPANGALAAAAAAQANNQHIAQATQCDIAWQQLAVLLAQDVASLRTQLAEGTGKLPQPARFTVNSVAAEVLLQRPDIAASELDLRAAAYDVDVAVADRYPRLGLVGNIGNSFVRIGENHSSGTSWSIGPLLSLPLIDFGPRREMVKAAQARLDAAQGLHQQRLLTAVSEVEQALLSLDGASRREADAANAARGFRNYFDATSERWRQGAANQIELETARRQWLEAQLAHMSVLRERVLAWVGLYKAVGGGWTPEASAAAVANN